MRNVYKASVENVNRVDHSGDTRTDMRIILKSMLQKGVDRMEDQNMSKMKLTGH